MQYLLCYLKHISKDDWNRISTDFSDIWNLPHVIGAMDGKLPIFGSCFNFRFMLHASNFRFMKFVIAFMASVSTLVCVESFFSDAFSFFPGISLFRFFGNGFVTTGESSTALVAILSLSESGKSLKSLKLWPSWRGLCVYSNSSVSSDTFVFPVRGLMKGSSHAKNA